MYRDKSKMKIRPATADRHMLHMNGNLLAVMSIITTGKLASKHDIIQITITILDSELKVSPSIVPYSINIIPRRRENIDYDYLKVSKDELYKVAQEGMDAGNAADLLEKWFDELQLSFRKKLAPLVEDWGFMKPFLLDWLGEATFDYLFDHRVRDIMSTALYINDRSDQNGESAPFPKVHLKYMASQLNVPTIRKPDTMEDCLYLIDVYKRLLKIKLF